MHGPTLVYKSPSRISALSVECRTKVSTDPPCACSTETICRRHYYREDEPYFDDYVMREELVEDFPEGGYGWMIVAACFFIHFAFFGISNIWGVFQDAYLEHAFPGEIAPGVLSMAGTLQPGIRSLSAPFMGILTSRVGFKPMLLIGTGLATGGLLLASFVTNPIYLLPTHGVMVGMGGSLVYIPILAAPSQWFEKRRAFVAGVAIAGSGVGGMVLAPVVQILLEKVGFRWTLRLLAIMILIIGMASGFLIRARLPFRQDSLFTRDTLSVISNMMFFFMSTTIAVYALIDYVPLYFITSYVTMVGESESNGAVALGVINASKAVGRIISGYLGDKCGRVNTLAAILFFSSLSCLAIWVPASNYVMLLVFSVTFGLSTGGVSSLTVSIIPDIFGIDRTATVTGLVFGSAGIPILIGAPVALVLRAAFGYDYIKVYCGIALGGAMLLAVGLRLSLSRKMIARV